MRGADVSVRPATTEDARFVFEVNNHPTTRARSISTAPISWETHERWFAGRLADERTLTLIGLHQDEPFGIARFDLEGSEATISVAIAEGHRGRGLGARLIELATEALGGRHPSARAIAWIRPDNVASVAAFTRAGYARVSAGVRAGVELDRFEHPRPEEGALRG